MVGRSKLSRREQAARAQAATLLHSESVLAGSLVTMVHTCGKKHCRCRRGQKHRSLYLSIKLRGKRKMIFVPKRLEGVAREGVENYRRALRLIEEISQDCLDRLLEEKGGKAQ